jgi:DNA-binding LacI/PurR family transcriptional regulator
MSSVIPWHAASTVDCFLITRCRYLSRAMFQASIVTYGESGSGVDRLAGYRDVIGKPDKRLIATGDYSRPSGAEAMDELLDRAPDLDAVFVCSDLMALGAVSALHRAGKRIPEDVAVGGFDDSKAAVSSTPHLTTIRQDFTRVSTEMVRLLLDSIGTDTRSAVTLPTDLVIRDSA